MRNTMKRTLSLFIVILVMLSFCSCHYLEGKVIPSVYFDTAFENDTYVAIDCSVINKKTGKDIFLEYDEIVPLAHTESGFARTASYYGAYNYDFESEVILQYAYLKMYYYNEETKEDIFEYYDCLTYFDYHGNEISRKYLSGPMTEEQVMGLRAKNIPNANSFTLEKGPRWPHKESVKNADELSIIEYVEKTPEYSDEGLEVVCFAKMVGKEYWFAKTISTQSHYNSGDPLLYSVISSEIISYNPDSDEFKVIYKHNKKGETIIDFTAEGLYTLNRKGNLRYHDLVTGKDKLIISFPSQRITSVTVTENFFYLYTEGEGSHFISKDGTKIAYTDF